MRLLLSIVLATIGSSALAFQAGTYSCKNVDGLPNNVYKITSVSVGAGLAALPYIDITHYFYDTPGDTNSAVDVAHIQGLASVSTMGDTEILSVAATKLEFDGGQLFGCTQ